MILFEESLADSSDVPSGRVEVVLVKVVGAGGEERLGEALWGDGGFLAPLSADWCNPYTYRFTLPGKEIETDNQDLIKAH